MTRGGLHWPEETFFDQRRPLHWLRRLWDIITLGMEDDFVEVTNELPYRDIRAITISSVRLEEGQFVISCRCDIEGSVEEQRLVRSWEDVGWLIENIAANKKTYLAPRISHQSYLSILYQKVAAQQGLRLEFDRRLSEQIVQRALNIVAGILLPHVKTLGTQYVYPIFIFFHRNFGLYKNPIYYKEESTPMVTKVGNFLWESYAKYSARTAGWDDIERTKAALAAEMAQFEQVRARLADYVGLLARLQEEYMGERERIKAQLGAAERLLLDYETQARYVELVVEEVKETLVKIESRAQVEDLMRKYGELLGKEVEKSAARRGQLAKEFTAVMCDRREAIHITSH